MIRGVIFDCFGVLYLDPSTRFYESEIPNFAALRSEIIELDKQYDYGFISADEHARAVADISGLDYEFVRSRVRGEHLKNERLIEFSQSLRPELLVGMLSNIGRGGMDSFFSQSERDALFDGIVLSSDVGMVKPSVEIFETMADALGLTPSECIMIDDKKENCQGAEFAGMTSVEFTTTETTIEEVKKLLI